MPPKKKLGRPPGSKNKKSKRANILREIKSETNLIKTENVISADDSGSEGSNQDEDANITVVVENKKAIYNCKKCPNKNFKFLENYKEHLLMEHSTLPGSVGCSQCHVVCPDKDTLDAHIQKVHNRCLFQCEFCKKVFARQAHVFRHMAQKGCDGGKVSSYPCEICNATFTRKDNLIVHLRDTHIKSNGYSCRVPSCDFNSKNFTKLIRHWHAKHAEIPNQFDCDHCGKATMSRAAMAKHLEIHGEKKYACDVCGYSTYTIEVMRRHILTHVEDKPYKCGECGNSYIQRSQLDRHMESHTKKKCDICAEVFYDKAKYMIHRGEHRGVLDLSCPIKKCLTPNHKYPNQNSLVKHVNKHLKIMGHKWACEVCRKVFRTEMNMRRHLSTHTLDRPRRCMYCVSARAYVRGQQLVRHVRKYHTEVFRTHLAHVRNVLTTMTQAKSNERVSHSEMESVLTLLDAEAERILEGYGGAGVLYGGMQDEDDEEEEEEEDAPLMSEKVLAENMSKLLSHLIDEDTLQCLGWPDASIDDILEKVIEQCGAKPADRDMWSRVQRLRENAKHLFLYVVDDKNVAMMLGTHTIDQIIKHMLAQLAKDEDHSMDKDDDDDIVLPGTSDPKKTIEIEIEMR